jgi:hypothetical protein
LELGIFKLELGIFKLKLGIFKLELGIFKLKLGIFNLELGIFNLELGIFKLKILKAGPDRGGQIRHVSDFGYSLGVPFDQAYVRPRARHGWRATEGCR